jgi:polyhydroxyalkanoate synthesis repressor PhaR
MRPPLAGAAGCKIVLPDAVDPMFSVAPFFAALQQRRRSVLVKKYGNRRLYDTAQSRYITLEDLADIIRRGEGDDVRVVSAKNGEDLTTATLAQIIVESRGAARFLPVPILIQLIRMRDNALAEFFGQYVTWALDVYLQTKRGVQAVAPFNPLFGPAAGLSRLFGLGPPAAEPGPQPPSPAAPAAQAPADDMAALRREIEELKRSIKKRRR